MKVRELVSRPAIPGSGSRGIHVEIGYELLFEIAGELFAPLRRSSQGVFFPVPTADHKRAPRTPAFLFQLAEGTGKLHQRGGSAGRINPAEGPGIAMIAQQDPFVGQFAAVNTRLNNRVRLDTVVHLDFQMNLYAAVEAIVDRQRALPLFRRFTTVHVLEQRLGVAPGEWQRDDLRQGARFAWRDTLGAGQRSPAGRGWVSGNDEVIGNRAPLDMALRAPWTIGKNFSPGITIFSGIGVDQHGRSAFALGCQRLESAITVRVGVTHQHDLALHADTVFTQHFVIARIAAVSVNYLG